jgi:hypothetical protein
MQAGFVGIGILSGFTAALFAIGSGGGVLAALIAYSGTGALAVLGAALPSGLNDPLAQS